MRYVIDASPEWKQRLREVRIRRKLSKIRVGLPLEVTFAFREGIVKCFPRERLWTISWDDQQVKYQMNVGARLDITKHKARLYLKLAKAGLMRKEKGT